MISYNPNSIPIPIDKAVITTSIPLAEVVGKCSPEHLGRLPASISPYVRGIKTGARSQSPVSIATRTIHVDGFDSIKLQVSKDPTWTIDQIQFNPGSLIHGHNGKVLNADEFHRALTVLIEVVTPLLANPNDKIHIVPGLHAGSRASWKSIEIPFHVLDEDGAILKAFANAKHKDINKPPLHTCSGQTITFSNSPNTLVIRIYRKDIQMLSKHGAKKVLDPLPLLRLEVMLKGAKLEQYLQSAVWRTKAGQRQLVSFGPEGLRQAFLAVMTGFGGCYARVPSQDDSASDCKAGRMMGWVAFTTGLSITDQFQYHSDRFLKGNEPTSINNAKSTYLTAARAELALLRPMRLADLFGEADWNNQQYVSCPNLEMMTLARHQFIDADPRIVAVYADEPAGSDVLPS
jgi:hypothetical protein